MKAGYAILGLMLVLSSCGEQREKQACYTKPGEEVYTPIITGIYDPTAPFFGSDNKYHLLYGLKLTNASRLPATIEKIAVFNAESKDAPIKTYEGDELTASLAHLSAGLAENRAIEKDGSRIFFVSLEFDDEKSLPRAISHKIALQGATGPGSKESVPVEYEAAGFCVCLKKPPVLSPPLKGNGWAVFNGCCSFKGVHQTSLLPVDGALYNAQRFATDFMKLNDQDRLYEGDPSVPANWHCYDQPIYAVADGEVVSVLEGLPDQPPGALPDPESITLKTITGNHVIIKIDANLYAFYAHLRKDSILVKEGERVTKGQEIARLGNSGNTSAPHLHLHLTNAPSPVGSNPVAYTYDTFKLVGTIDPKSIYEAEELDTTYGNRASFVPEVRKEQLPMDMSILDF